MRVVVYVLLQGDAEPIILSVRADPSDSVDDVKRAIKASLKDEIQCVASRLNLYVAKTEDGKWLKQTVVESVTLDQIWNGVIHLKHTVWRWRVTADAVAELWPPQEARATQVAGLKGALGSLRWVRTKTSAATHFTAAVLDVLRGVEVIEAVPKARLNLVVEPAPASTFILFFDGGSRGNPGPGGSGAVVVRVSATAAAAEIIWSAVTARSSPTTMNNTAEYDGLLVGLKEAAVQRWAPLEVVGDSSLILGQMQDYRAPKAAHLLTVYAAARRLPDTLGVTRWNHHLRAFNRMADTAANIAMDARASSHTSLHHHRNPPEVHILVEEPTKITARQPDDEDANPREYKRFDCFQQLPLYGPVRPDCLRVPLDSISAFTTITTTLASATKPLLQLLYGPRQFGKTTIADAVYDWHQANNPASAQGSKTLILDWARSLATTKTSAAMWEALGRRFRETRPCADEASFLQIATTQGYDRFFLIVDELHQFFVYTEPAKQFIATLQRWQTQPFFAGFLGVGSEDLVLLYQEISGDHQLKSVQTVCVEPFSTEQMCGFYELVYTFGLSSYVKDQIRECSGGRPGIFVALIDYVRRQGKCNADQETWQQWQRKGGLEPFAMHQDPNSACRSIRNDLRALSDSEWTALEQIVEQQLTREEANEVDKPNETDRNMKMMVVTMEDSTRLDKLFRMQVVTRTNDGVAVASAVMLCLVQKEIRERKYGFEKAASEVDVEAWYFICERGLLGKKRHRDD